MLIFSNIWRKFATFNKNLALKTLANLSKIDDVRLPTLGISIYFNQNKDHRRVCVLLALVVSCIVYTRQSICSSLPLKGSWKREKWEVGKESNVKI